MASPIRGTGRGQVTPSRYGGCPRTPSTRAQGSSRASVRLGLAAWQISRSVRIEAPAERVWELVSDLPGMGALSPENTGGTWRGGATGPAVGARFRGSNRNGWRRWSTRVQVTRCEPGRSFALAVSSIGIPVSEWAYDITADGDGACVVVESLADRRPGWFKKPAGVVTGVLRDRGEESTGEKKADPPGGVEGGGGKPGRGGWGGGGGGRGAEGNPQHKRGIGGPRGGFPRPPPAPPPRRRGAGAAPPGRSDHARPARAREEAPRGPGGARRGEHQPPGPELVQLLTPEGERVSHPDYDIDLTDEEYRGLYRDLVLVRRIDVEATALQRQGELGIWAALLGQEAAQVGSGRALRPQDFAFPTYREHGVAWCRGVDPLKLLGLFRGVEQRRLGPAGEALPPLHDRHRQPDPARHRLRHGHHQGRCRRRPRDRRGGHRLLRRRRVEPGRRQRGLRLGERLQRPDRLLLPEQPVGHLDADGDPEPHPALQARRGLRLPGRPGRRQRRPRVLRGHPARRSTTPAPGRARRSSRPSPTGWARTPPPTTRPATGSPPSSRPGSSRTRSSG